ncbi:MAG: hypothetical protein ABIK72_07475 [candidate division WOR-3 bacterium]
MRTIIGKANPIILNPSNPTQYVRSDRLFTGIFQSKSLIHSIMLKINVGTSARVDEKCLGSLILEDSKGRITTIDLLFYKKFLEYIYNLQLYEVSTDSNYLLHLPLYFATLEGIRPKDTYLVAEKCNDYFIMVNGRIITGITYNSYTITPYIIGEKNLKAYIPSEGFYFETRDTIPSGRYTSKLNIQGATSFILVKSDYTDFPDNLEIYIDVDGENRVSLDDFMILNTTFQYLSERKATSYSKKVIVFKSTLDKKLAKVSRNSNFILTFNNPSSAFDVVAIYKRLHTPSAVETTELLKRMNVEITNKVLPVPIDHTGKYNPSVKPIARKVIDFENEERVKINV